MFVSHLLVVVTISKAFAAARSLKLANVTLTLFIPLLLPKTAAEVTNIETVMMAFQL